MPRNWAIVIGINEYNPNNFHPLNYAKRDSEAMRDFFRNEASFDEVCFFSDDSPKLTLPNGSAIPTYPSCGNLCSFLQDRFEKPFLKKGDNCWFFFAGHGQQYQNRDYLMPIDAPNPRGKEPTYAIPVSYVRERLSRSGADNVILLLDACRDEGSRDGARPEWEPQQGIITISACSPLQKSWEIDSLQQGVFTYVLLEALRMPGERNCATVERLDDYLRYRVPQLCRDHGKIPEQLPRVAADPAEKLHFILLPKYATKADTATLKNDAYRAERNQDWDLAERLWIRCNAAASGQDMDVIEALQNLGIQRRTRTAPSQTTTESGNLSLSSPPELAQTWQSQKLYEPPAQPEIDEVPLRPENGTDYSHLQQLLKVGRWKEADLETYRLMITTVGKKEGEVFEMTDLENFPSSELRTLNKFWLKYSNDKWGFSIQQKIWQECGSPIDYNDDWEKFGERVGWRKDEEWLDFGDLTFDLNKSLPGELPWGGGYSGIEGFVGGWWRFWGWILLSRVEETCEISTVEDTHKIQRKAVQSSTYQQLEEYLKAQRWKEADRETFLLMLKTLGREEEDYFRPKDLLMFPCEDLIIIDRLWVKYSNSKFGFSIQTQIWQNCGEPMHDDGVLFGEHVGWCKDGDGLAYDDLIFDLEKSLPGELPSCMGLGLWRLGPFGYWGAEAWTSLFTRIKTCAITPSEDSHDQAKPLRYQRLEAYLSKQEWKEADRETFHLMITIAGEIDPDHRRPGSYFSPVDLENFPCDALRTLDQLWLKYSNGKFGLSVQKKIWQKCGNPTSSENWHRFCVEVGWQKAEPPTYMSYSDLKFDIEKSPLGELPGVPATPDSESGGVWLGCWTWYLGGFSGGWGGGTVLLFSRLKACNL